MFYAKKCEIHGFRKTIKNRKFLKQLVYSINQSVNDKLSRGPRKQKICKSVEGSVRLKRSTGPNRGDGIDSGSHLIQETRSSCRPQLTAPLPARPVTGIPPWLHSVVLSKLITAQIKVFAWARLNMHDWSSRCSVMAF